ncbi:hypothetical protein H5410_050511 [Solanum commersonii]|uniref:Uncharacterized protein n=1 Tax=Solanum commersonii TaxID=4109 RepID=A0A9J5WXT5_SOLCO|nr:hypothetical protein H5410_050511 [Solanum commersonii]
MILRFLPASVMMPRSLSTIAMMPRSLSTIAMMPRSLPVNVKILRFRVRSSVIALILTFRGLLKDWRGSCLTSRQTHFFFSLCFDLVEKQRMTLVPMRRSTKEYDKSVKKKEKWIG